MCGPGTKGVRAGRQQVRRKHGSVLRGRYGRRERREAVRRGVVRPVNQSSTHFFMTCSGVRRALSSRLIFTMTGSQLTAAKDCEVRLLMGCCAGEAVFFFAKKRKLRLPDGSKICCLNYGKCPRGRPSGSLFAAGHCCLASLARNVSGAPAEQMPPLAPASSRSTTPSEVTPARAMCTIAVFIV